MDIIFESVAPTDKEKIVTLGELVNEKHIIPSLSAKGKNTMRSRRRRDIEETFNSSIYKSIKAILNNEIIGYIAWRNGNYIAQLYVKSEYQYIGVGKRLVKEMLLVSESKTVELKSSINAVGFYEKLGFKAASEEQQKDGVSYVPMVFNTTPPSVYEHSKLKKS